MKPARYGLWLSLLTLLLLASGCGFQLRGEVSLPSELQRLNLSGVQSGSPLSQALRQSLTSNGVELSETADLSLAVLGYSTDQRAITFTGTGQSAQFEVSGTLRFNLQNSNGTELMGPFSLDAQRTYQSDQNNTTASISERKMIDRELERSLVQQLMLRLQAITSAQLAQAQQAAEARELQAQQAAPAAQ
ncbi:LPS assembly lipoprotein LptE [Aestuariirhabdus litorea]|uniref:LPS-assembly lipoprotein LptE n=1 Tax=Aestuariirhabdus litorea TaxID=2528527 RepID=A0A3P3VLG2_9GAMM|nr:LPS assembly lipoprotein LptE [Aestuariirhabdus litorea]RRJ83575.1 hypothetical protein D0544_00155 [Aestuariirhabdus litorea]RWW96796.1 hypothetical protein DZC74_00155 [Endozoicomonadaceae bacterium GTF-13]